MMQQKSSNGSLRTYLQESQSENDDAGPEMEGSLDGDDEGYDGKDDDSSGEEPMNDMDADEIEESGILPRTRKTSTEEYKHPKPHNLIVNEPLRHFWDQYFPEKQYVRWTTFLNKIENHLSSPREESTGDSPVKANKHMKSAYPVAPQGYGLHQNELYALFRERDGKRNLMKSVQYALDLENTGVLSVYQVALVVKNILPATLPLKHLLFHLAHLGGKVILPAHLYPVSTAVTTAQTVRDAFQRAVAAEKDYSMQQQKALRRRQQGAGSNGALDDAHAYDTSLSVAGLYSPYAKASEELLGPVALQDNLEAFVARGRGTKSPQDTLAASQNTGAISVYAGPCGQGTTCRMLSAVRAQLHSTLQRRHALMSVAAVQGSLSVWDLLNNNSIPEELVSSSAALLSSLPTAHSLATQQVTFSSKQVAEDDFVLSGLFDAVYIDLRGRTTKADVLSAFSAQLALRGTDANLQTIQESLQRFLRSLRPSSVLILDHVHSSCAGVVKSLLSSCLTLPTKKNKLSVLIIPAMQAAAPILTSTSPADAAKAAAAAAGNNSKLQRSFGSASRRKQAWEKEQEAKATAAFASELRGILTALGVRWVEKISADDDEPLDSLDDLPSNVMLTTHCLSSEETRALAQRLHREITMRERLLRMQDSASLARSPAEALGREAIEAIISLSGGVPGLIRLLHLQSTETLTHLLARRDDQSASANLPAYMSSANTVRGSTGGTGLARNNSPTVKLAAGGASVVGPAPATATNVANNPYVGLPSLYSIGWELQHASPMAFSVTDRLALYALSPLLYAHFDAPQVATKTQATSGAKPAAGRPFPLIFDQNLAWSLCKPLFVHHVTTMGAHNSVQTFAGKRGVAPTAADFIQEEARRLWQSAWAKLQACGWLHVSDAGVPTVDEATSRPGGAVYFTNAAVPQFVGVRKSLSSTVTPDVVTAFPEELLMRNYLKHVAKRFVEVSQTLSVIAKLLLTPEADLLSSLPQQRQLLILTSLDPILLPHVTFLASVMAHALTPAKTERAKKSTGRTPVKPRPAADVSEDDAEQPNQRTERANSYGTDTSDPIVLMRLNSSNSRADRESMGENIEQVLSYSLDEEDRQSEDGSVTSSMERRRMRTHSEVSSDDGTDRDREGALPAASSQPRSSTEESALLTAAEAKEILTQWGGHCRVLCLLRLPSDVSTTLAVHAFKNLKSLAKTVHVTEVDRQDLVARHLMDLGLLLLELYLQHGSEGSVSQGWSRGSLHYTSVESAVSRHLAATSSKLLQEALEVVQTALRTGASVLITTSLLIAETQLEFALGRLSLAIAAEAQRMAQVACTTTSALDEILVVKLQNKAKVALSHGLELLENVLPVTLGKLNATLQARDKTPVQGLWEKYRAELVTQVVGRYTGGNAQTPPSPVRGISVSPADAAEFDRSADSLPENLQLFLHKLTAQKLSHDVALLVAEHFMRQMVERKLGDINASFVQCMAPPAPAPSKKTLTAKDSAPLPLPKGILSYASGEKLSEKGNAGLIAEAKHEPFPARDNKVVSFGGIAKDDDTKPTQGKKKKNFLYPLMLHNGTQDLLQQLLDREFLAHQDKLIARLAEQQASVYAATRSDKANLPTPVSPVNAARSVSGSMSPLQNPAAAPAYDLVFIEDLTPEEETELRSLYTTSTTVAPKFSNVALIHCWRKAKTNYEVAIEGYTKLFGSNSLLCAEVRVCLANLLRCFGRDEDAKPLYELSLKVFKFHNVASFQLPTGISAHCWLGLASYFNVHGAASLSASSSTFGVVNPSQKNQNDLALRLYEEALSIYKCVYPTTHYNVALTAQALAPILSGLQRYERGQNLLQECVDSARLTLSRDRIMQRYLNRQLRVATRRQKARTERTSEKVKTSDAVIIARLEKAVESNEQALQATINYLGTVLVTLGKFLDSSKQPHLAAAAYKEAIVCFRELRLSIIRRFQQRVDALKPPQEQGARTDNEGDSGADSDDVETLTTTQPERELALQIAQTMRLLSQSLFDEGVKQMGGRRFAGVALPDFQYRNALYVINRAIEIYHDFDLTVAAPLLKDAYSQKAAMHILQGDLDHAKHCYEQVMRLFMEVKFENYEDIAVVRTELGRLMVQAGEPGEAALLFQQSIDVYRRRPGESWVCIQVAENLLERGAALLDLKVHDEAQPCLEDCLKMLPMVLGADKAQRDPRMAACHNHLASVFHFYEEFGEALTHYKAAQQIYQRAKMESSLELANVCNNLATLYDDMGQLPDAKAMYEQTVVILFRYHGAAHPQILVTLENLMNLLLDMGLKEEHQSVLDHLDVMEKQIVQANKDDKEKMEALNRAMYGQAIAEQERRQLAQRAAESSQRRAENGMRATGVTGGVAMPEGSTGDLVGVEAAGGSHRAHPFAPQVVIVGGGADFESDESDQEATYPGDNADVLLSFQAQEQALHDDQQDSFFNFSLQRNLSATRMTTAEEEWCKTNNSYRVGRAGGMVDDAQDEEDGNKWANRGGPNSPLAGMPVDPASLGFDTTYMGAYNNNSELQAMKREMNLKYSAENSTGRGGQSLEPAGKRGSIADSFRRGSNAGPGGRMRTLKPLGARKSAAEETQEEELPSGNCVVM